MADDACSVAAVFCAIGSVNLIVNVGSGFFYEGDVFVHAASLDVAFMPRLNTAKPGGCAPVHGPNVQVVTEANNPDDHQLSQRAVAPQGRDLQLFCGSDLFKLVARPRSHWHVSFYSILTLAWYCSSLTFSIQSAALPSRYS
jgi:hypothetical protein